MTPPVVSKSPAVSTAMKSYYRVRQNYLDTVLEPLNKHGEEFIASNQDKLRGPEKGYYRVLIAEISNSYSGTLKELEKINLFAKNLREKAEKSNSPAEADKFYREATKILLDATRKYNFNDSFRDSYIVARERYLNGADKSIREKYQQLKKLEPQEIKSLGEDGSLIVQSLIDSYQHAVEVIDTTNERARVLRKEAELMGRSPAAEKKWQTAKQLFEKIESSAGKLVSTSLDLQLKQVKQARGQFHADQQNLIQAEEAGWKIEVIKTYNTDSRYQRGNSDYTDVAVDPRTLKGPLVFSDPVRSIRFSRKLPDAKIERDADGDVVKINGEAVTFHNKEQQKYYTSFIASSRSSTTYHSYTVDESSTRLMVEVYPKNSGYEQPELEVSLPVDLEHLGVKFKGKRVATAVRQRAIHQFGKLDIYNFYSVGIPPRDLVGMRPASSELLDGMKYSDYFFGVKSGTAIKDITLINTSNKQGYFVSPSMVVATDEILKTTKINIWLTGFHEGAHAIDSKYDISSRLKKLHNQLLRVSPDTFGFIDEAMMFEGSSPGHPGANEKELFASAMSSLTQSRWEDVMNNVDPAHRYNYGLVLKVIRERLEEIPEFANTPVLNELTKRTDKLNKYPVPAENKGNKPFAG